VMMRETTTVVSFNFRFTVAKLHSITQDHA